jgi:hypothetical protein
MMNGKKIYALLGSLTVALSCVTSAVVAKDAPQTAKPAKSATAKGVAPEKFSEVKHVQQNKPSRSTSLSDALRVKRSVNMDEMANTRLKKSEASVRLDTLIATFNEEQTAPAARSYDFQPRPGFRSAGLDQKPQRRSVLRSTTLSISKPVKSTGSKATALAVYKHANSGADNVAAVSHRIISNSATQVLEASLDKPGVIPRYRSGEHMVIKLHALQNCNVMVFDYDNKGTITQLYPNDYDKNGSLHSDETVEIGGEHSQYTLDVDGNGPEQIFVYAYPATEKLEVAMAPVPNTPFRSTKLTREQYDRLIAQSREYSFGAPQSENTSEDRGIKITEKSAAQNVSVTTHPANKLQLVFEIEK